MVESMVRATAHFLQGERDKKSTGKKSIAQQEKLNFTAALPLLPWGRGHPPRCGIHQLHEISLSRVKAILLTACREMETEQAEERLNQLHWEGMALVVPEKHPTPGMEQSPHLSAGADASSATLSANLQHLRTIIGLSHTGNSIHQKTHPRPRLHFA